MIDDDTDMTIGIPNFRDVGGHETAGGAPVRAGRLFRSVALDRVSDEDLVALERLGLRTIFDLRTREEQARYPDRLPHGATLVSLDVLPDQRAADYGAVAAHLREPESHTRGGSASDMERFNVASYRDLVRLGCARAAYHAFFERLADGGAPALVHCTGGKDRTGWAVAALLLLLGVDEDAIMADYLASHEAVRARFAPMIDDFVARGGERSVIEAMLSAKPAYLRAAIDTMAQDYGSIESYFSTGLGLDDAVPARLRTAFLE